jgi:cyclohexadienyl dehydratase
MHAHWMTGLLAASCIGAPAYAELPIGDHLRQVSASKDLRVCIWPDYFGISYRNPKTQELSGIDIDLARELAHDLGPDVSTTFVESSFSQLVPDLLGNRCEIAMSAVGITPERVQKLQFSEPYLRSDVYAITTRANRRIKDWNDIDRHGTVVAVAKGTLHETVMQRKLRFATLLVLDTPFAREREVEAGRADVFMTDFPYSQRMLQSADWARLVSPPGTYHLPQYAYAIAPGDKPWLERINRFVSDIRKDGRLRTYANKHKLGAIALFE